MKSGIKTLTTIVLLTVLVIFIYSSSVNDAGKMNYTDLLTGIANGEITEIQITSDREKATAVYKTASDQTKSNKKSVTIPSIENFMTDVSDQIKAGSLVVVQEETSILLEILETTFPFIILIVFFFAWAILMNPSQNNNNKSFTFGKSKARMVNPTDKNKLTFKDVAGIEEEKAELEEIVEFLKSPKKYTDMGARIPKGVLLVGRPGTGKTLLAKAVAGEAGVPFFIISGSDFVEMFVGVGASRVRDLFEQAKKNAPCIVFIDEIDAVGRQRGAGLGGGHDEREQTLNQLLVEMDGFAANEGVIVLAATNRPDVLDKALLRAGRFDRQIIVAPPDVKAREQILNVHARKKKIAEDVDMAVIAKNTAGFVGADLENVLNEAALLAARRDLQEITMKEIEDAMVKVTMGPEKKSKVISDKEKKLVAYHESGHAISSYFLETQEVVHEISIIPRGMAGGYTMYEPSEDKSFLGKKEMQEQIVSLLGGRVAEGLILGDVSTGASNDIERATKIAREMVTKYGMSEKLGTITFGSGSEEVFLGRDLAQQRDFSEETAAMIDQEVKAIIDEAYNKTVEILKTHMDQLHKVAGVLMEKEKIDGEEFTKIMEEKA